MLHDGDTVELGGSKLVAHLTPGHTIGCTTWTMQVRAGGRTLNVVIVGSPNVNPGYVLAGNKNDPHIPEDYVKTFAILKSLPCDIFLGAHGAHFGLKAKYTKTKAGEPNPFIDPDGSHAMRGERASKTRPRSALADTSGWCLSFAQHAANRMLGGGGLDFLELAQAGKLECVCPKVTSGFPRSTINETPQTT